uniref:Syndecan n=1 Tax=Geotrypetes seraphini TaxID=260995 RepID=A0A6P8QER7_GEOSA|nr:syndecan-1 [Geotrypetes seraphini]
MVRIAALSALVLCFTLVFSNDITNQAPEDQDGSGDDEDTSGFGSGFIFVQDTVTSKPEGIETILTTVPPSESTIDHQSAIDEVQRTSDMVTTSPTKDSEENALVGSEEVQKSNITAEDSEMKTSVDRNQINPIPATSTASVINSTIVKDVHDFDPSAKESEGVRESTTTDVPLETDLIDKEFLPAEDVNVSTAVPVTGDAVPTNNTAFRDEFVSEVPETEGSGQGLDRGWFFETTKEVPKEQDKKSRILNEVDSEDNGTTDASKGIMDRKEVLGGVIAGGLVGLLFAVFLVGFMLYRMKKKDEGSYSLEEPKHSNGGYQKPHKQEEFYA